MELVEFGQALLTSEDLDPVYTALHGASLDKTRLRRWLMAYWCCYHMGCASWLSEQDGWSGYKPWAINETEAPSGGRWPRGRERRHFRGQKAVDAVSWFERRYASPEAAITYLEIPTPTRYNTVRDRAMSWPLFGPWIAFKIGDMMERLLGLEIDFSDSDVFFFDSPREAAELWFGSNTRQAVPAAVDHLKKHLGELKAPPSYNRTLNLQEYETILCKWKSHQTGHYPIGIDTHEGLEALHGWSKISPTAKTLLEVLNARQQHPS